MTEAHEMVAAQARADAGESFAKPLLRSSGSLVGSLTGSTDASPTSSNPTSPSSTRAPSASKVEATREVAKAFPMWSSTTAPATNGCLHA